MRLFARKTPLAAVPGLSNADILRLKSYWINTWEEYCAYAKTYSGHSFAGSGFFASKIDDYVFQGIQKAEIAPRQLGCYVPEERLRQMASAYCGSITADGVPKPTEYNLADEPDLPHEVRLMDRMAPVRDQGKRGTCTAFAAVAICEFAEGRQYVLSPQFLYWACKERDSRPNMEGTGSDTIQEALYEDGVCEERLWPYCSKSRLDEDGELDAGQGPAPDGAVENAKDHRRLCRALSPNAVMQYRKVLASGKPVFVGIMTFNSWLVNPYTAETGRVPMPLMEEVEDGVWHLQEESQGGHAMCLVGYVDDASVPGGGYFIVRNSWGEEWASECEEGAGHALIPYLYMAFFTSSAFTIVDHSSVERPLPEVGPTPEDGQGGTPTVLGSLPPNLKPFAKVLDRETRDFRGTLLPKGACVLSLPQPGSPLVEYKPENFSTKEYRDILAFACFAGKSYWTEEQMSTYDSVLRHKQEFCAKIDENLAERNLKFKPFPDFKFSWNLFQLMGVQRIWSSSLVMDFSDTLFDSLLADAMPPEEGKKMPVPDEWRKIMRDTVSARIYKVNNVSLLPSTIYVVEAFATPFEIDAKTGLCQFACPAARLVETVRACALTALDGLKKGKFVFYTIGTGLPLDIGVAGVREGACSVIVSGPAEGGQWDVRSPGYLTGQSAYRDFSDRLMPLTREDVVSAVKAYVDGVAKGKDSMSSGKVSVDNIVDHLHNEQFSGFPAFRQTAVIRALLQMQGNDPGRYAVCKETEGTQEVFVIPATEVIESDKPYKSRNWLTNLLLFHSIHFLGLMLCSALFIGKAELEVILGWNKSFVLRVVLAAATMCVSGFIQNKFNSLFSSIEKD